MRRAALLTLLPMLIVAASAPAQQLGQPLERALDQARKEQAAAEAETAKLEKAAAAARGEAERLAAAQAAAAQALEAAEARITAADAQYRLSAAYVAAHRQRLAEEQRPVSSLLAGLAVMARRPPLLAIVDGRGADELVKVSLLLDSTLPAIRRRTSAISAQLEQEQRLEAAAVAARAELARSRQGLATQRQRFAELERKAIAQSLAARGEALQSGDVAMAAAEQVEKIRNQQATGQSARQVAARLAAEPPAAPRPTRSGAQPPVPFPYVLPLRAPIVEGLGAVDDSGVRSRGVTFASARGTEVVAPASGTVRFSGPFRGYDGVLIIDHGRGWVSLVVNVTSPLQVGQQVRLGEPIGRALGVVEVQLSADGRRLSPALIAGSYGTLSKGSKGG